MSVKRLVPLRAPDEIPPNMTEQQARDFWDTHEVTEEYLQRAGPVPDDALPAVGDETRTVPLRIDAETFRRVKALARTKQITPQALLTEALADWLPAAEKREELTNRG